MDKKEVMDFFKPENVIKAWLMIKLSFTVYPELEE